MKKLLVAVLAMATVSAFAQKHMVRFSEVGNHNGAGDFNLAFDNDKTGSTGVETSQTSIALNYAHTVAANWQVGLGFAYENGNTEKSESITVSGYYNFSTDLANAYYAGLHYTFGKDRNSEDKISGLGLEGGKRFALGSWQGFNLTYAPNVTLAQAKTEFDAGGDDDESMNLTWNFLKFDVLF